MSIVTNDNLKSSLSGFKGKINTKIDNLNSRIDKLDHAKKVIENGINDFVYASLDYTSSVTPTAGALLPFKTRNSSLNSGTIVDNGDYTYTLKGGFAYDITVDMLGGTGRVNSCIYDYTGEETLFILYKIASNYNSTLSDSSGHIIFTPDVDSVVGIKTVSIQGNGVCNGSSIAHNSYFIIKNISTQAVDPVEYIDQSKGLQDTPVGTVYDTLCNSNVPNGYLPADGREVNIGDYPEFENYLLNSFNEVNFYGGDGETTYHLPRWFNDEVQYDPNMTSNSAPSPYVASADSEYTTGVTGWDTKAYNAFHNRYIAGRESTSSKSSWISGANAATTEHWLKLDFGAKTRVGKAYLTNGTCNNSSVNISNTIAQTPKTIKFEGSYDNSNWYTIHSESSLSWSGVMETKEFDFDRNYDYRYYRAVMTNSSRDNSNRYMIVISNLSYATLPEPTKIIKVKPTYYMQVNTSLENNYSTAEQQIGYWIDGKKLYQKTITATNIKITNGITVAHGIENPDMMNLKSVMLKDGTVTPTRYASSGSDSLGSTSAPLGFRCQGDNIVCHTSTGWDASANRTWYFTIQYTKTTD